MSSVLMLTGAVGAGKSDTSYRIFDRFWRNGIPTARLDFDDLGMCHPTPDDDPENHRVKSAAVGALWPVFRARGTERLIVSGGVDTNADFELYRRQVPDASWLVVRLRLLDPGERRRRLERRGTSLGMPEALSARWVDVGEDEERRLDGESFWDLTVDTDDDREGVVDGVLDAVGWQLPVS